VSSHRNLAAKVAVFCFDFYLGARAGFRHSLLCAEKRPAQKELKQWLNPWRGFSISV
jgi:hypothetical protein